MNAHFNIRAYGASGAGSGKDTAAIQSAIAACAEAGGGTVYCPPGTYVTGTIQLLSRVTLHLEAGATLLASADPSDYDTRCNLPGDAGYEIERVSAAHLIHARGASCVAVTGRGVIDGNGRAFFGPFNPAAKNSRTKSVPGWRPGQLMTFSKCRDVLLRDITIVDSPYWAVWPFGCDGVTVDGITIRNDREGPNTDGIDIDCCRDVCVSNCRLHCGDDCFAIRSDTRRLGEDLPCENVVITNCVLSSPCCAIRVGFAGDGPIRNCLFNNLTITRTRTGINMLVPRYPEFSIERGPAISDISFQHLRMETRKAFFLCVGEDARPPACIRNVTFSDITATTERSCFLGGSRANPIIGLALRNVALTVNGEMDDTAGENAPDPYPMWGSFAAGRGMPFGLYGRDLRELDLRDVRIDWGRVTGPWRNAVRLERVERVNLAGVVASSPPGAPAVPAVRAGHVRGLTVQGCRTHDGTGAFLDHDGCGEPVSPFPPPHV